MTVLGTVTGNGELLPPFILYGYQRYQKTWMDKLPDGNNLDIVFMYFYTVIFQFFNRNPIWSYEIRLDGTTGFFKLFKKQVVPYKI